MKPKISTGYLTPQAKKSKNVARGRLLSDTEETTLESGFDENLFANIMKCPEKKHMILKFLAANKKAIDNYKKKDASPVAKIKKKPTCESPTALLRRRALEQMNSSPSSENRSTTTSRPSSRCSGVSSSQSASPVPFEKILSDVVAYVEIKNKGQDRSSAFKILLQSMGAKIREQFSNDVTHVIFKDGSFTTFQKAKLLKIHLVSILWVDFCKKTMKRQPEKQFPALRSGFQDNETSMICSQMQKEYEDIIRDEYRKSIVEGTPLPSTRSLIDRRRTLMTPSVSNLTVTSYETAADNISSQEQSDQEVARINGFQTLESVDNEDLIINDPDCFSEVSGPMINGNTVEKRNSIYVEIGDSDMELTEINNSKSLIWSRTPTEKRTILNDSDMVLTNIIDPENTKDRPTKSDIYNAKTPKLTSKIVPTNLFDRRKTICNSLLSSDTSTASLISSDKSTKISGSVACAVPKPYRLSSDRSNASLISSDKSTNISDNVAFAVPNPVKKPKTSINSSIGSNESFEFGRNKAKSKKMLNAELEKTASAMSELVVSTDNNTSKSSSIISHLQISSDNDKSIKRSALRKSTSVSSLSISSELKNKSKSEKSTSMSELCISSEISKTNKPSASRVSLDTNSKNSIMSSLQVSSEENKKATDRSSMSSLQISTDSRSASKDSKNTKNSSSISEPSLMSSLHLSSEKGPKGSKQIRQSLKSNNSFSSTEENNSGILKQVVENVIRDLSTPECVTKRKKSSQGLASVSKNSLSSDDSEIISPRKITRRPLVRTNFQKDCDIQQSSSDDISKSKELELLSSVTRRRKTLGSRRRLTSSKSIQNIDLVNTEKALVVNIERSPLTNMVQNYGGDSENKKADIATETRRRTLRHNEPEKTIDLEGDSENKKADIATKTRRRTLRHNEPEKTIDLEGDSENKKADIATKTRRTLRHNEPEKTIDPEGDSENKKADIATKTRRRTLKHKESEKPVELEAKSLVKNTLNKKDKSSKTQANENLKVQKNQQLCSSDSSSSNSDKDFPSHKASSNESSDSTKSKRKLRKLYNPDDSIPVLVNDEEEREQKRLEVRKRKSEVGVLLHPLPVVLQSTVDKNTRQNESIELESDDGKSPIKRAKKGNKKELKRVTLNSSADEQKDLLNEVVSKKNNPAEGSEDDNVKTPKVKGRTPKKLAATTPSRRKSTRIIKSSQKLGTQPDVPTTPNNRRSSFDFQPVMSSSKKPKKIDKTKLPTIVCTKLHKSDVQMFAQIVKKLGRFQIEDEVSSRTTHLVAGEAKRTINMLRAVSRGCWVLKWDWVLQSLEAGKWLREEDFEVHDFSPVVQKSRLERCAFGSKYTLDVFESCPPIYVAPSTTPRCSDLKELITLCRGRVVTVPRMAKIVVGEYLEQDETTCVKETWVLDCITFNKSIAFKQQYLLKKNLGNKRTSIVV